jgi:hypothetical protein
MTEQIARHLPLVPDETLRAAILESPELIERWPVYTGPALNDIRLPQMLHALAKLTPSVMRRSRWPEDVTLLEAARLLANYWKNETSRDLTFPIEKGTAEGITALLGNEHDEIADALRAALLVRQIDVQHLEQFEAPIDIQKYRSFAQELRREFPLSFWGFISEPSENEIDDLVDSVEQGFAEALPRDERLDWFVLWQLFHVLHNWHPLGVGTLCSIVKAVGTKRARDVVNAYSAEPLGDEYAGHLDQLLKETLRQASYDSSDVEAVNELRREVRTHLALFAQRLGESDSATRWLETLTSDLEGIGGKGTELASNLREKMRAIEADEIAIQCERWKIWKPRTSPPGRNFIARFTLALWVDRVLPRLKKPAALAMLVHDPVVDLFSGFSRLRREEERNGQRVLSLPGDVLVRVLTRDNDDLIDSSSLDRGLKLFGSVTGHKLLRWQIYTAHRQAIDHNPDPRVIRVEGGYAALAHDLLGLKGRKAAIMVRSIIEAEHSIDIPLPPRGEYVRLLIRRYRQAVGQRPAYLELVLGTVLLPDYVHELQQVYGNKSLESRRATRLVPVLPIPPLIGRDNEHGAQATLSMLLVAYLRDHARDIVQHGGVTLNRSTLVELARRAAFPYSADLDRLLERWTSDGDDGPAMLKLIGPNRYTLGDAYAAARAFIEEGGRRELDASDAGKSSVGKRAAARRRKR